MKKALLNSKIGKRIFGIEIWNVGRSDNLDAIMKNGRIDHISWRKPPGKYKFYADPVGTFNRINQRRIIVEELSYFTNKGHLVSFPATENFVNGIPLVELKDKNFHLSYPFVLSTDDREVLIPECAESGRLRYFELEDTTWVENTSYSSQGSFIDPTIILHKGVWYLFHTSQHSGPTSTLHLKYSDNFHGPWHTHPSSPIRQDSNGARPAGPLFYFNNKLFRPAQDCSQTYGGAFAIFEVTELSTTSYREHHRCRIEPSSQYYEHGIHSFLVDGQYVYIDGKVVEFTLFAPIIKMNNLVRSKIKNLLNPGQS